jgi:hypothetical protein
MTFLLFAGVGAGLTACLIHLTLGLRRPVQWKHLTFAGMSVALCAYLLVQRAYYVMRPEELGSGSFRIGAVLFIGWYGLFGPFVHYFTGATFARWQVWCFYAALLAWFVVNLLLPYGIFFPSVTSYPTASATVFGERLSLPAAIDSYALFAWYASTMAFDTWVLLRCGIPMAVHTSRVRGTLFSAALAVFLLTRAADVLRDVFGGVWPYTGEFGVVVMSVLMSVGLAFDFRANGIALERAVVELDARTTDLARMVEATRQVRYRIDSPLEALRQGIRKLTAQRPGDRARIVLLDRAITRLTELQGRLRQELAVGSAAPDRLFPERTPELVSRELSADA